MGVLRSYHPRSRLANAYKGTIICIQLYSEVISLQLKSDVPLSIGISALSHELRPEPVYLISNVRKKDDSRNSLTCMSHLSISDLTTGPVVETQCRNSVERHGGRVLRAPALKGVYKTASNLPSRYSVLSGFVARFPLR